jgi:hypothetical protein
MSPCPGERKNGRFRNAVSNGQQKDTTRSSVGFVLKTTISITCSGRPRKKAKLSIIFQSVSEIL